MAHKSIKNTLEYYFSPAELACVLAAEITDIKLLAVITSFTNVFHGQTDNPGKTLKPFDLSVLTSRLD